MDPQQRPSPQQRVLPLAPAFVAVLVSVKQDVIDWVAKALEPHGKSLELHVVSSLLALGKYPAQTPVRCLMFESAEGFDDAFAMLCAYHLQDATPIPTLLIKDDCNTEDRLRALALGAEDLLDISAEAQRMLPLLVGRTASVAGTQSHLVRNEREFRAYLEESPDAVVAFAAERVAYANPRFMQLLASIERNGLEVKTLQDVLPAAAADDALKRLEGKTAVPAFDVRLGLRHDLQTDMSYDCIVSARLRWTYFEGQRALLLSLTDVSNERRQQSLQQLHSLGEMVAGVAHDFNNFVSAIIGRIGILRRLVSETQALRSIDIIEQAATDAAQVVARMRHFSRVDEVPKDRVTLAAVARDALEMVRPRLNNTYRVLQEHDDDGHVRGDATELREVLVNLMNNALDAMPGGGQLELETRINEHGAFVSIRDTGYGMSDEVRARALEPFFTTKGKAGTGLGLSLSHAIVRRHGGSLQIQSNSGKGTVVTLRFTKS